jgi:hypothetical protein
MVFVALVYLKMLALNVWTILITELEIDGKEVVMARFYSTYYSGLSLRCKEDGENLVYSASRQGLKTLYFRIYVGRFTGKQEHLRRW